VRSAFAYAAFRTLADAATELRDKRAYGYLAGSGAGPVCARHRDPRRGTVTGDESTLYHHFELNYTPISTQSGRRLARR
jgi:hypothetical protein